MRRHTLYKTAVIIMGGVFLAGDTAPGQVVTFRKIADTDTLVPGGTGTFSGFGQTPSLSGANVAFVGTDSADDSGIYLDVSAVLGIVADTSTSIPGGTEYFSSFSSASLSGTDVAFRGAGSTEVGVYTRIGGVLGVVADTGTAIPGGTGNFTDFDTNGPSIDGGNVAFVGSGASGQIGVYTDIGGTLNVVADGGTMIPGGSGTFSFLDAVSLDGGDVAFRGFGVGELGIYTEISSSLSVVADLDTAIPGGTGNFTTFGKGSIDNAKVALRAGDHPDLGIYSDISGQLDVVADTNTPMPRAMANFLFEGSTAPSIRGGDIAFAADGSAGQNGIYALMQGYLIRVVDRGVSLDGKTGLHFEAGPEAMSGQDIVFHVSFTDNSEGIYVATVPLDVCGNGIPEEGEDCDEGGEWTGCDADCTPADCGDGTLNTTAGEECDDGVDNSDTTPDACRTDCKEAYCGDGTVDTGEVCDDGNTVEEDACTNSCERGIPTVSEWGLIALALLLAVAGTALIRRHRPAAV
ncbi:MAG: IPTL-CTERM sorting domain-containing protein [Phycisphaerales bacterium]|nr:MAG: IPTL-CTERM sorting domain-containing protein [Phycisphaerales bacterium]